MYIRYSACYSSKKQWQLAADDAAVCITKDPNFIKGYFRLATAISELGHFEEAYNIIQEALRKEPGVMK